VNAAFEKTLAPAEVHLAHRLESFGDVVFGFTISQLALQFRLPVVPSDLVTHWPSYFAYAVTFAAIALLWLSYHRMLSTTFAPKPLDIAITFLFLGFTGLVPYAMYAFLHFAGTLDGMRYGYGAYLVCAVGTTGTALVIRVRNYLRGAAYLEPDERLRTYRRLAINSALMPIFIAVLAMDISGHLQLAWILAVLPPLASALGRRLIRTAPVPRLSAGTEAAV
jgi:uncharacterized membrane protein